MCITLHYILTIKQSKYIDHHFLNNTKYESTKMHAENHIVKVSEHNVKKSDCKIFQCTWLGNLGLHNLRSVNKLDVSLSK